LSGIFLAAVISNPLFGHLSDRRRIGWIALVLTVSAAIIAVFPRLPPEWLVPAYALYGFFFMASYPMVEAALMETVPDPMRGRAFGFFITIGGLVGNLSHWMAGGWVKGLGSAAHTPAAYYPLYLILACMLLFALLGLPCLHAIRRREKLATGEVDSLVAQPSTVHAPQSPSATSDPAED
jgi:MFS family permease